GPCAHTIVMLLQPCWLAGSFFQRIEDRMIPYLAPVLLLICSNVFMTFAWYGQLRYPAVPLAVTIVVSWGIAFFEYCLAVPANRIGHQVYSAAQLKTMQEIITLVVFAVFSVTWLGEPLKWNQGVAFLFLCGAAYFSFRA
ncbi:MAG TPA: DMT family protein, partial [Rhizomicrobium sp.]|nr:DMT family protein [Rhizomicrobium sp.]